MSRSKIPKLYEAYQPNAWPAMVQSLADELGVSVDALDRLGVGYAPAVEFRTGKYYKGWWVLPQRDAEGAVVGLALRGLDGRKGNVPGSKGGLFYEPASEPGERQYRRDWIRTVDAGVACPICEKPDGCLISDDDLDDPSDVICCRVREGSIRPQKIGFLHRRRGGAYAADPGVLPNSEYPVVVVEGPTDAAAAMTLGFVAVGRPGASALIDETAALVRRRHVIIVGENDKAGSAGLEITAASLSGQCPSVKTVFPPEGIKDLRQWVAEYDLTRQDLLDYAESSGHQTDTDDILSDDSPLYLAQRWLTDQKMDGDLPMIRIHRGQWFEFDGVCYREIDPNAAVRGPLYEYLQNKHYTVPEDESVSVKRFKPTKHQISNVMDAMYAICPVHEPAPCWLDDRIDPRPKDLIAFQNVLLDPDGWLAGEPYAAMQPTPHLFSTFSLPYEFDPNAKCPNWLDWLDDTLGDDPEKISLLQEWFGYCLTPDMGMEKLMIVQGRPGAGKGTMLEVLRALVGEEQVATTSFSSLASDSGRAPLVGKLCAFMPDARLPARGDHMHALETLLAITGQDGVNIKRKYLPDVADFKLSTRFTVAVNELPELPDHAQALIRRTLMIQFAKSFVGREDQTLKRRLIDEVPGIAIWALEGLRRVRDRRSFTTPPSSKHLLDEFRRVTSPVVEFVEDCCVFGDHDETAISKNELYDAWAKWAYEKSIASGSKTRFSSRLTSAFPHVETGQAFIQERKTTSFLGVTLQPWACREYLGRNQP